MRVQREAVRAGYLPVPVTIYGWLRYATVMSGEDMIRIISLLMGGRYEKR